MTIAVSELQVLWAASVATSIAAGGNSTSDALTVSAEAIDLTIVCKADNQGSANVSDQVDAYVLYSVGDPDGSGTIEYVSTGHAVFIGRMDTTIEEPALITGRLNPNVQSLKIYAVNNSTARSMTFSATMQQKTG